MLPISIDFIYFCVNRIVYTIIKKEEAMKKNVVIIALVLTIPNILLSAEKQYNQLVNVSADPIVRMNLAPASVIGTKGIDTKLKESLSQEQQKIIYGIEHPSYIKALYGFNNQVISQEDKDALRYMPKKIRKGLVVRVKKVEGSCCIAPNGSPNRRELSEQDFCAIHANKAWIPTAVASTPSGVGFFIKMMLGSCATAPWAPCAVPIIVGPPLCAAACAEGSNCAYHRCCAEDEIWYSNDNSQSDSESKEQND
jgi:hypothetical protein